MIALMELKKQPLTKLILDLRNNGGGVLEEAIEIADEFLEGDKLISYTEGFHSPRKEYRCRRLGQFEKGKLIVLCNENTASASEILLGALQDWERATIIGKRSFGKGLLQDQYNLSNGAALRLTIAKYYTPLGRSIQRSYAKGKQAYYEAAKTTTLADSSNTKYRQLTLTKSGKKLYDHSGISPDVEMEQDTIPLSPSLVQLLKDESISHFGYRYFLAHPSITSLQTVDKLLTDTGLSKSLTAYFNTIVSRKRVSELDKLTANQKILLTGQLKLSLANQLFGKKGFYKLQAVQDRLVAKALSL